MSFTTFPAALPYFEELGNKDLMDQLIANLGSGKAADSNVTKEDKPEHPFMTAFNERAKLTYTKNGALAHKTTKDAIVDLYYGMGTARLDDLKWYLNAAWCQDRAMTVRIILYARSIHRGKSLKDCFFFAYGWLLVHHPRTALANLHLITDGTIRSGAQLAHLRKIEKSMNKLKVDDQGSSDKESKQAEYEILERRDFKSHGYWKDLCTLLTIYCQGEIEGPKDKTSSKYRALHWPRQEFDMRNYHKNILDRKMRREKRSVITPEEAVENRNYHISQSKIRDGERKQRAQAERRELRQERNKHVNELLQQDKVYRALHFTVAQLFADQFKKDMAQLEKNKQMVQDGKLKGKYSLGFNLSLAAKWAPSIRSSHDKHTFLVTTIAELLFPPSEHQEKDENRVRYLNKIRDLLRKNYLIPLRAALDITEHYMAEGKWEKVDLQHASSVCLQKNLKYFFKHAPDEVKAYLEKVASGKLKASGETLSPNQLVYKILEENTFEEQSNSSDEDLGYEEILEGLVNGQWNSLIESIRDTALLKAKNLDETRNKRVDLGECIAICDVSGSMTQSNTEKPEDRPLYAAIGLSLVLTNLAKPPFNGALITFSAVPELFNIDTNADFATQVRAVGQSSWGFNTDLIKVFVDVLLPMAKKHNLAPEDMVKRLFIFSDMEFDEGSNQAEPLTQTTHQFIKQKYNEAGYEMPEIVWWNLAGKDSRAGELNAPVTNEEGVSLLSGFSASMMKAFLDGDLREDDTQIASKVKKEKKKETPLDFIERSVYHESFDGVVVID